MAQENTATQEQQFTTSIEELTERIIAAAGICRSSLLDGENASSREDLQRQVDEIMVQLDKLVGNIRLSLAFLALFSTLADYATRIEQYIREKQQEALDAAKSPEEKERARELFIYKDTE